MKKIQLLLVDDHNMVRQGLRVLLEAEPDIAVIGEAETGRQAVQMARTLQPDVIVMDIAMPNLNGLEATRQIVKEVPNAKVLVLSSYGDDEYLHQLTDAGACGYLLKQTAANDLIKAVRETSKGNAFFSPAVARIFKDGVARLQETREVTDRFESLTDRERQVYQLLAEGNSNKDIANRLNLSLHTVETHRWRIMEKLDLHSTAELVLSAVRRGMVT